MDLLSDVLSRMRLEGTLYFRTAFTSPWSVKVPQFQRVARFHFAHKGRCFVRIEGEADAISLEQGDLIIIPHGASHTMFCDPTTENQAILVDDVVAQSGFDGRGALVLGEPGTSHETQLVCGHFAFDSFAQHPVIEALPGYLHIQSYNELGGAWLESTLRVIGAEAGRSRLGSDLIALKLSEIVFAQALRHYLETEGENRPVLAAFNDKNIAKALDAIHNEPGFLWTIESLAETANMSRTTFLTRFNQCMSMTPLQYMTYWRMQIARQHLAETDMPIIDVAESIGYQSEAAFGRVFKKHFDVGPATFRRSASTR